MSRVNYKKQLETILPTALCGSVARTEGMSASVAGFPAPIGAMAEIESDRGSSISAQVIGFRDDLTLLYPYESLEGVRRGNRVRLAKSSRWLRAGDALLGRVIDADGEVIDAKPRPVLTDRVPFERSAPKPCSRRPIEEPLGTGVRAIDAMLTCGRGQRLGLFAGSGVGKSTLLGMMARYSDAEVIVIGLIGERGREVNEFIRRDLGPDGLAKSVVVVATSDQPALVRMNAAQTATAIAEYFRDQGKDVLLLVDSLTRFALASREIGLAAGEPPSTRGYPPSVFARLPKLLERAGQAERGSITAFYSVLVEGDDPNEPISDAVRGLLDGHVWLSRKLASAGQYPAIDLLDSLSRLMNDLADSDHRRAALLLRQVLAAYRDQEDMVSIGAYRGGSNRLVDIWIENRQAIRQFLTQEVENGSTFDDSREALLSLCRQLERTGETDQTDEAA
jgi:flagellum-specific ATP synthase